jgi:flagellar assembly protein FliH
MSNRILADSGATPVTWRKLDPQHKLRPQESSSASTDAQTIRQIEKATEEAYARGFASGVDSVKSEAASQVQPLIERLSQTIKSISDLRPKLRREAEEDLVKLSIAVARRILNRELSVDPESIQAVVRVALEKLKSREVTRVRIHSSHEPAVRNSLAAHGGANHIQLIIDPTLQPGDVILETSQGSFDGSLEFQLREIERGFTDRLNG